ncbi:MAG: HEAT repeat domain-containing protein [Gemmatimonadaceae bacterium]
MTVTRRWLIAGVVAGGVIAATVVAPSAREPVRAMPAAPPQRPSASDTAAVARFLMAVRGADPLLCELAARSVDGRGWWSGWGGGGGSASGAPLEVDSAAAATIRRVHDAPSDARLVPRLAAGLRDTDRCVRRVSGSLLGRVKHAEATGALLSALDDTSAETRAAAAIGLGLAEEQRGVQPLIRRLRDASPDVRRSAAWALGAIEDRAALLPLIETLERDTDARVRQAVAWAIGNVTG